MDVLAINEAKVDSSIRDVEVCLALKKYEGIEKLTAETMVEYAFTFAQISPIESALTSARLILKR